MGRPTLPPDETQPPYVEDQEYWTFNTQTDAQACIDYINTESWWPRAGQNNSGAPASGKQQTISWAQIPREMTDGKWAFRKIPDDRFDYGEVPPGAVVSFLASFGLNNPNRTVVCTKNSFVQTSYPAP